jgi:hypothetical protein
MDGIRIADSIIVVDSQSEFILVFSSEERCQIMMYFSLDWRPPYVPSQRHASEEFCQLYVEFYSQAIASEHFMGPNSLPPMSLSIVSFTHSHSWE